VSRWHLVILRTSSPRHRRLARFRPRRAFAPLDLEAASSRTEESSAPPARRASAYSNSKERAAGSSNARTSHSTNLEPHWPKRARDLRGSRSDPARTLEPPSRTRPSFCPSTPKGRTATAWQSSGRVARSENLPRFDPRHPRLRAARLVDPKTAEAVARNRERLEP
jgi:hypothetical protein